MSQASNTFPKLYFIQHTFKNSKYHLFKTLRILSRTTPSIFHQIVLTYCISLLMLMLMMIVVIVATIIIIIIINYLITIHYVFPLKKIVSIGVFSVTYTYQESPVLLTKKKKKKYFP